MENKTLLELVEELTRYVKTAVVTDNHNEQRLEVAINLGKRRTLIQQMTYEEVRSFCGALAALDVYVRQQKEREK